MPDILHHIDYLADLAVTRVHKLSCGSTLTSALTPSPHQEQYRLENINDIRIIGIDESRPPIIRKEPYIDLFFKLSQQAPEKWCEEFNLISKKLKPPVTIDKSKGLFIDAYVREMNQIPAHLETIKKVIASFNEQYMENIRKQKLLDDARDTMDIGNEGAQGKLNKIIAALKFDD